MSTETTTTTEMRLGRLRTALDSGRTAPIKRVLRSLKPAEVGVLIESLPTGERDVIWNLVSDEDAGEVLLHLNEELRVHLIRHMDSDALIAASEGLELDDLADFVDDLPETMTQRVLDSMDQAHRERLEQVMSYSWDTAGGLMNPDAVSIRPDVSIEVVLRYLRFRGELPGQTDALFVVDRNERYLGALHLDRVVTLKPDMVVGEVMDAKFAAIDVEAPATEVTKRFEERDLISAPVVDAEGRLLGRITVDDVVDILRDEAEHNLLSPVGLDEEDDVFAPVRRSARRRAVWLGINLLTAFIAARVVGLFEATLDAVVALAVLMPVVASMGGIGGSQTLTLMIRGLALGTISNANALVLLKKEVAVAAINGVLWAGVVAGIVYLWFGVPLLSLVIAAALVVNQIGAAFAGVGLPLILKRLDIDPALAGSVVLTTITDVVGFFAFLGLGAVILL